MSEKRTSRRAWGDLGPDEVPDVDVFTSVRAKRLRFGTVPESRVWFEGEPAERSSSETERENLPDEVEPDVTYRDVAVRWRARSRIVHPTDDPEDKQG
jgi:hypothetical protein